MKATCCAAPKPRTLQVNPGLLFPLKSGFAFVERPPLFLPYGQWNGVSLGRAGAGNASTFDLMARPSAPSECLFPIRAKPIL